MIKKEKRTLIGYSIILFVFISLLSCSKDKENIPVEEEVPEESTDLWEYGADYLVDSTGNHYYLACTEDRLLEIRVRDAEGKMIFSEYCPTVDSTEIPLELRTRIDGEITRWNVYVVLTAPSKYISADDATLSILLGANDEFEEFKQVQLLANINLKTKEFYTKKYKVEEPLDWSFVLGPGSVTQWYQNTLLVREGTQKDLNGGGFMWLGSRGTQLVCYERDFSIRYTKDIDVSAAYYPGSGGRYIPVSNTDAIGFSDNPALITRTSILVSVVDEWAGVKPEVWEVDLKRTHNLPSDYQVEITDYNVKGDLVTATYRILDGEGVYRETRDGEWDLATGMPRKRL